MILRKILRARLGKGFYSISQNKQQNNECLMLTQGKSFVSHVYGIELKKHLFPALSKTIQLSTEEVKFYQKMSPNYIVALINQLADGHQQHHNINPFDKFYNICTYCQVKYSENTMDLQGLCRVKIKDIQKVIVDKQVQNTMGETQLQQKIIAQNNEQQQNQQKVQGQDILMNEQQMQSKKSQKFSIANSLKKQRKKSKPHENEFYYLHVKKVDQLPLVISDVLAMKFKFLIQTYIKMHNAVSQRHQIIFNIIDLKRILDNIANYCSQYSTNKQQIQRCLEAIDPEQRIDQVQKLLQKTIHLNEYLSDIERTAQNNLRNKKFYEYYSQIMKVTKQVMDGNKPKEIFLQKCTKQFYEKNPSQNIKEVFQQSKEKYYQMDQNSIESGLTKTYLQALSKIPYNLKKEEIFDLMHAKQVLQQEHYGMQDAKKQILQIIAVGKLKGSLKGKVFCFVGGPGLGKTTFAKSVANALHRQFYSISLGGVTDSSALKGHRRTYVGAYNGKIIQALQVCGSSNPVILLDEIDKMGSSYQGDPRSQLLQILDPNQNSSFIDNFIDVPVDLSQVLFICSANYQSNISKPLLDRMEIIRLSSYTNNEKAEIFKRHLLRRAINSTGVTPQHFILADNLLQLLLVHYSLGEPGVRYLEKLILKILEKVAYKVVTAQQTLPIEVNGSNITDYIGNSYYRQKDHLKIPSGVAISLGGNYENRLTYIEAFRKSFVNRKQSSRGLMFTGSLGDVFKEAMNISYTYIRNYLRLQLQNVFLYQNQIHIHAPDGASKKDGSTDSLTIASAIASLALDKQVKKGVGMTGELTLHGRVLRTHNIKQKILLAKRQKLTEVVVPEDNSTEIAMLSQQVRQGLVFHYVKTFRQVYQIIF